MPNKIFLRAHEAQRLTALSRSSFYAYIARGLMPPPIKIGERMSAWLVSEIESVNTARVLGKSPEEIKKLVSNLLLERSQKEAGNV